MSRKAGKGRPNLVRLTIRVRLNYVNYFLHLSPVAVQFAVFWYAKYSWQFVTISARCHGVRLLLGVEKYWFESNTVFTRDTFTWGKLTFLLYCVTFCYCEMHLPHVNVSRVNTAVDNSGLICFSIGLDTVLLQERRWKKPCFPWLWQPC